MTTGMRYAKLSVTIIGLLLIAGPLVGLADTSSAHQVDACELHAFSAVPGPGTGEITLQFQLTHDTDGDTDIQALEIERDDGMVVTIPITELTDTIEVGSVDVGDTVDAGTVDTVTLGSTFDDPVVAAYIPTRNGASSVDVRVKNVTSDSFDLFIEEPDGEAHKAETVSYIVAESGVQQTLGGELTIEAGHVTTDQVHHSPAPFVGESVAFDAAFAQPPTVLATLQTYENADFMSTTVFGADASGFDVVQEAGQTGSIGATETIGWIAVSLGSGTTVDGIDFLVGSLATDGDNDGVDDSAETIFYTFDATPTLLVQGATGNGADGYWARGAGTYNASQATLFAEEDQVGDTERSHADEAFGFAAFTPATSLIATGPEGPLPYTGHWIDSGLGENVSHTYEVTPICSGGETGPTAGPTGATTFHVPSEPRDVTAASGFPHLVFSPSEGTVCTPVDCVTPEPNVGEVEVTWRAPDDRGGGQLVAYEVLRASEEDGNYSQIGTTDATEKHFRDTGVDVTETVFYKVRAVTTLGPGPLSDAACAAPGPWVQQLEPPTDPACGGPLS